MRHPFLIIVFAIPAALWAGWASETVAAEGDVGAGCSLAVDRWGRPHISYVDATGGKVMYVRHTGSSWEFENVAEDVTVIGRTAIALDAFDRPRVLFQDDKAEELTYAYKSGGKWETEKVDAGAHYGSFVSVNAWPDEPRVSYDFPVGMSVGLKYGYRDTEGWQTEKVVSSGGGLFNTLVIDVDGNPNIIYTHSSSLSIRCATLKSGKWSIDDIAEGVDCDAYVGPAQKIHVSFSEDGNKRLNYAVSTGSGSWKFENVTVATGKPANSQICVNGAGDVFISYFNFDKFNLHIVTKKGGSWTHEVVAAGEYSGGYHSTALGNEGYPLIAYYDGDKRDLKFARYFTDVELTSFTAERARGGVDVRWAVDRAGSVAGYNLYRSAAGGQREKVNAALVEGFSPFRYRDAGAAENVALKYWLEAVATTGTRRTFGPASVPPAGKARTFALYQNAPNPFAGTTTFAFELPEGADVKLAIYDAAGRKVADVAEGRFGAGRHEVAYSDKLPPGVYVYRLDAGAETAARKMVVTK